LSYGMAKPVLANPDDMIEVPGIGERGPRSLSRQALAAVIEPRVEELFALVQQVVRESGYEELLSSGVVLTGGTALMEGMVELGEDIFLKPARIGVPDYQGSLSDVVRSPRFATVMGLLEEARVQRQRGRRVAQQRVGIRDVMQRMKDWFTSSF
jgi:cell division protein FtsA